MELAEAFHLPGIVVMDEFSEMQTQFPDETFNILFVSKVHFEIQFEDSC